MWQWQLEEARARQQALFVEARQHALAQASLSGREQTSRPRPRAIVWFGGQLIIWGNRLQGCRETLSPIGSERLSSIAR